MATKQAYVEFWEAVGSMRANLLTADDWETSYSATFFSALTLEERLSFSHIAESVIWIGIEAKPTTCAAADHRNRVYAVFGYRECAASMAQVAGLEPDIFLLIDLSEFMNLIFFLVKMAPKYKNRLPIYVGGNQNVRTWILNRSPENRVARYLTRLINRLEVEYQFTLRHSTCPR